MEDDGDQDDASYPEGGSRMFGNPGEDDEDTHDSEPSLGSSGHGEAGAISYAVHPISDGFQTVYDCEGDEHDGREPDEADNEPSAGFDAGEPSLGWTVDGVIGDASAEYFDAELHGSAPRDIVEKKIGQRRSQTELRWPDGGPVTAESLRTRPSNVINMDSAVL